MKRIILFLFIILTTFNLTKSEELDTNLLKPMYGVFGNAGLGFHFADFLKMPGTESCCLGFNNSIGSSFNFGLTFDYPINYKYILNFRAGYNLLSSNFRTDENTTVIIDGNTTPGVFTHNLNSNLGLLGFDALFGYRNSDITTLHAGLSFLTPINSNYEQWEEITKPSDRGVFPGTGRTRNYSNGEIPNISSLNFGLTFGISAQFPMNKRNSLFLVPEIYYSHYFLSLVDNISWKLGMLRGGIAIKYRKPEPPPPPPPPPQTPPYPDSLPLPIEPPILEAFVDAIEIDSLGKESKEISLKIEDFVSFNLRPLLTYVFFDENSYQIPTRYNLLNTKEAIRFDIGTLSGADAIETYYDMLNIIGKRLKENLDAKITLVGSNSNIGPEENNLELSKNRAEQVKKYFTDVWLINPDRIEIKFRNLPEDASKSDTIPGQEENRRVEIISTNKIITDPVITNDTLRVISNTDIKFFASASSEVGIKEWDFQARQNGNILFSKNGVGIPKNEMLWKIRDDEKNMPRNDKPIKYQLTVLDSIGQKSVSESKELKVEQLTVNKKREDSKPDKEFEYYSLILFSYGKSSLEQEHREVVDFVKNRIGDEAKVYIYGYSDSMGDDKINQIISERRAKSVANRLKIRNAEVIGKGESELLFDNNLPEGRFYCRTVQITVETPVKEKKKDS